MPATDEGEVRVNVEMAVGTQARDRRSGDADGRGNRRAQVPEAVSILSNVGGGGFGSSGGHTARGARHPRPARRAAPQQRADRERPAPGSRRISRASRSARGPGRGSSSCGWAPRPQSGVSIEIRGLRSRDGPGARAAGQRGRRRTVPGITDTRISREEGNPEQIIRINREKAADLGLGVTRIGDALQTAVGGTLAVVLPRGRQAVRHPRAAQRGGPQEPGQPARPHRRQQPRRAGHPAQRRRAPSRQRARSASSARTRSGSSRSRRTTPAATWAR